MNPPLISLLVPAYREELVIEDNLKHLAHEIQYPNKEILVGVDGLDDQTHEIVCKFAAANPECRIRIFLNKERQGLMRNMKRLICEARGEILVKHDADRRFGNPQTCLQRTAQYFSNPEVGGLFFTGERDMHGGIFAYCDPGYRERITAERERNLLSRAEAFIACIVDILRTSMFPFTGQPKYPIAIHCFRRSIWPDPAQIPTDLVHDDVLLFYQTLDAGFRVEFAPDIVHWTYGGFAGDAHSLFRQKVKGFVGWADSSQRHSFNFYGYLFDVARIFMANLPKAKCIDLLAFFWWCIIVAAAWVAAQFKRHKSPEEVWTGFQRDIGRTAPGEGEK